MQVGDLVDREVKRIVESAEVVARDVLRTRCERLEAIAKALLDPKDAAQPAPEGESVKQEIHEV